MEISEVSENSLRIKGKSAVLLVNPIGIRTKTAADSLLLLSRTDKPDLAKVEEYRLIVSGAGEYEVSGSKISSVSTGDLLCHFITLDGSTVCVASTGFLSKKKDFGRDCPILVLLCNEEVDASAITELSPSVLVLSGKKTQEVLKSLGKEGTKTSKLQITSDKLPEEMQVTVLG